MSSCAKVLSSTAIFFCIIHYFIIMNLVIVIAVIFPCIIFGFILALAHDAESEEPNIHIFQKVALIIIVGFIGYLIVAYLIGFS